MTDAMEGQESLFGPVMPSTKTSEVLLPATKGATSKPSLRKLSKSSSQIPLMCLCLTRADGHTAERCMEWRPTELPFPSPGVCTMPSGGAFHSVGNGIVCWRTLGGPVQENYCLTLNIGEKPRVPNPTKLSQILERETDPKYNLSAKACQGILNRAERRGKELPAELKQALIAQTGGGDR